MCFCETNRISFMMKTGDNVLRWNWMRSKRVGISIRFVWNENMANTPHLNPLPYTTTGLPRKYSVRRLADSARPTRLPPRREEGESPLWPRLWRTL
jgi:hypothetical protein